MKNTAASPETEQALLTRAEQLAGLTLAELAEHYSLTVPKSLNRHKGWIGQLLELALGADGGSHAAADFSTLGIELKTLPISAQGKPLETTFVCVAPLTGLTGVTWQNCYLRYKLSRVLWVPIISDKQIPIAQRIIATPFLWSPTPEQEQLLQQDWQELTDMIVLGKVEQITGRHGQVLQLRPKAANSQAKTKAFNHLGQPFMTLPRGFYLKIPFTQQILQQQLLINN
jgi:DNA mismatch repair protein MutH